jgi:hypothetical protein
MAEKRTIELEVKESGFDQVTEKTKTLKQQLKEMKLQLSTMDEGSQAFKDLLAEAGKLDDKLGDINTRVKNFASDTAHLDSALAGITAVAGGFEVVQGAMGLLGSENKNLEKALLRVQSAMALANGAQQVQNALQKESAFMKGVDAVKTTALSVATGAYTAVVGTSTGALKAFRLALVSTGIGVLLVALGAVVAYWDDISKALGFTTKESEKYAQQQKLITEQAKEQRAEIAKESGAFTQQILRLKATNEGSKERKKLIGEVNKTYGTTFKNLKDEAKFQAELNIELASYLEYQKAKYQLQKNEKAIVANLEKQDELTKKLYDSQQKIDKARKDGAGKQKRTLEEGIITYVNVNEAADKSLESTQKVISQTQIELDKAKKRFEGYGSAANTAAAAIAKLTNNNKKFVGGSDEINDKVEENVDKLKGINDELVAYYDAIEQDRQSKITDAKEKEQQELANKYEALYLLAEKAGISTLDLQKEHGAESSLIRKKYDDLEREAIAEKAAKEKAFLDSITLTENQLKLQKLEEQYLAESILYKDNKEILAALDAKYLKDKEALNKDTNDKIAQNDKEAAEKKQNLLNSQLDAVKKGLSSIANIAELFAGKSKKSQKRAFDVQKATNIATATIDTFMSAQSAYKSLVGVPVVGPVIAPLAAAGAIAAGLINIKKIKATQFEGGTPPTDTSVPTPTGGEPQAPQFNVVGNNGMNQLAQLQQQPIQAYVVSSEMTSAQALERNRINNATI